MKNIIIMGVSGCGKSLIASTLAKELNVRFIDADDLHPRANILKMASNMPLDDNDRLPWLKRINDAIFSINSRNLSCIIACSALKKLYRDELRKDNKELLFIYLKASKELILKRLSTRAGHYMKAQMIESQFSALEPPKSDEGVISLDASLKPNEIINQILKRLKF